MALKISCRDKNRKHPDCEMESAATDGRGSRQGGDATMRLNKQLEVRATSALLAMLANDRQRGGHGLRTSEMCGTPVFHGERTLSSKQIARLLRKTGKVAAKLNGSPRFSYNLWTLSDELWDQARKARASGLPKRPAGRCVDI
jgi:hypothetical protein